MDWSGAHWNLKPREVFFAIAALGLLDLYWRRAPLLVD